MGDANSKLSGMSMRLFGAPHQFGSQVDPRINDINSKIGYRYAKNIMMEAPILTLIPGKPIYMQGESTENKINTTQAFLQAAIGDNSVLSELRSGTDSSEWKLYDFELAYSEYMEYVNMMAHAGAAYLGIEEFQIPYGDGESSAAVQFDWRTYHWSNKQSKDESNRFDVNNIINHGQYIQFYIDPDINPSESFSNSTSESQLMSTVTGTGSGMSKELQFLTGMTMGNDEWAETLGAGVQNISDEATKLLGDNSKFKSGIGRLINLGGEVVKGNNIIMPEIYQGSSAGKNYSITIPLRIPYGNKYSYYLGIFIPMVHLLAATIPKQSTANSYSEPFLVKAYIDGLMSVTLGIIEDISISRATDGLTVDGLPTEVNVTISIKDLYSDMTMNSYMNPSSFVNNSSLVTYLATSCGMSLVMPNYQKRLEVLANGVANKARGFIPSVMGQLADDSYSLIDNSVNGLVKKATSILPFI